MKSSIKQLEGYVENSIALGDIEFSGISIDSRNIQLGNIFLAIKGERFDGHDFLEKAIESGAVGVVAEKTQKNFNHPTLIVPNTKIALQEMAKAMRNKFQIPIIGVTGSNGKTTVKEMISSVLEVAFGSKGSLSTQGNLNNEIGVPLTIFRLNKNHKSAVIEMGMNHPGEITILSKIAQPTIGLVNNAQREHQEFMHTVESVAIENGSVIDGLPTHGIAVFPGDSEYASLWRGLAGNRKTLTFGFSEKCNIRAKQNDDNSDIEVFYNDINFKLRLNTFGVHNILNALACVACCIAANVPIEKIKEGLEMFQPVKGRLQKKKTSLGVEIIDDTYNANPDSVIAAINVLSVKKSKKVLVLGDMGEVGAKGPEYHKEIADYALQQKIDEVFVIGDLAKFMTVNNKVKHFEEIDSLILAVKKSISIVEGVTVLVKGSRFMKMERVVEALIK